MYARCDSEHIRLKGAQGDQTKYQCQTFGYQARFVSASVAKAAHYVQVETLLTERNSQRSILLATGVARMTIVKLLKRAALVSPRLLRRQTKKTQRRKPEALTVKN